RRSSDLTKRSGCRAELAAGAGLGGAPRFHLPEILHRLVCAGGAGPAPGGYGARAALAAPLLDGLVRGRGVLVRRLLLDSVRAVFSRRAGGRRGLGGVPVVRGGEGAPHGSFRRAGRGRDAALVGRSVGGGAVGGGGSDARAARLRVAGAGQRRHRYGDSHAPRAVHRSLRAFVRVRPDGGGAGAGGDRAAAGAIALAGAPSASDAAARSPASRARARDGSARATQDLGDGAVDRGEYRRDEAAAGRAFAARGAFRAWAAAFDHRVAGGSGAAVLLRRRRVARLRGQPGAGREGARAARHRGPYAGRGAAEFGGAG